jgi:hypothetical protein
MKIKYLLVISLSFVLASCGCYDSREEAWQACKDNYNGKCHYLGRDYKVCDEDRGFNLFGNSQKKRCLEIVRGEGISETYCDTASGRSQIFNSNLY